MRALFLIIIINNLSFILKLENINTLNSFYSI